MSTVLQDLRYGLRVLAKNPGFTAVAAVTLALGIGANSTIFSWINSTLLNPIPGVARTNDLVSVMRGERSEHPTPPFSYLDYLDLRDHTQSFSGLLAYHDDFMSLAGTDKPQRIYGALTSANYFDVLGVRPILGRGFLPAEEQRRGGGSVAVISESLWRARFGSDRSIIGKTIQINRHLYTIVGVAPPDFQGCKTGLRTDVWIPLGMDQFVWGPTRPEDRGVFWLQVLGKLKPGVDRRQAEGELNLLMQQIIETSRNVDRGPSQITLDPLWRSPFGANVYLYKTLPMLLALAAVLLLLACANVANLLLVRSVTRRREIALRLSMGASRWRLIRQLLVETLLLALVGGALALTLTTWTAGTFAAFFPPTTSLPLTLNGHIDRGVLLATLLISIVTAALFGVLPALRTSSLTPIAVLKEEAGSMTAGLHKSRLSSALVVAQICLSLLLLICAGLFIRSLQNAQRLDPGFDPNHVLLASYELGPMGYSEAQGIAFDRQLLSKLAALPGVESATLADFSPLSFTLHSDFVSPDGYVPQPHESMEVSRAIVGPNYFRTMRTPLVAGREFTEQDAEKSQRVTIVNQEFVNRYWPGQDGLGKRVSVYGQWFTVVGVARNGKYRRLVYAPEPVFFQPLYQRYRDLVMIHARVSGDPQAYAPAVERTVHELNADLPVFGVTTLKSSMRLGSIFERVAGTFAGAFGLLALILAAVGIYGVIAYSTRQRTHEIAIRMAVGAQRADVFRLVLGQGLLLTLAGLAAGIAVSLALTRYLKSVLFGVTTTDVLTYAAVAFLLCLVSLVACYIPARRATKVDPMVALRYE
ncbi:MAG: ABC transporter permease [Terriglobia bacterium]|jgi:predicted permease